MATSVRPNQVAHQRVRDFNLLESRLRWPSTNLRRFVTFRTHPSQELSVEQPCARTIAQRKAVERQAFALSFDLEIGVAPFPAIEAVHGGARDQPELVRALGQALERQRFQAIRGQSRNGPA